MNLEPKLERMQADGRITTHDADEVRNFADFLTEVQGCPVTGGTTEQVWRRRVAYARHYPEDCRAAMSPALYAETVTRMNSTSPGPGVPAPAATAAPRA